MMNAASDHHVDQVSPARKRQAYVRAGRLIAAAMLLIFFLIAARLFTWHNGFSYRFHPDEITKARQLQSGEYNFYHPQLLFRGAQAMLFLRTGAIDGRIRADEPRDKLEVPLYNRILLNARTASALFAAGAVVLLAMSAYWQRGSRASRLSETAGADSIRALAALAAVAASLIACPSLLANAHFAKEDAALVFGVSAWVAAGAWFARRPSLGRALLFAAACGLVVSGKWIGGVLSIVGLIVIVIGSRWMVPRLAPRHGAADADAAPAPGTGLMSGSTDDATAPPEVLEYAGFGLMRARVPRIKIVLLSMAVLLGVVLLINAPVLWQFGRLVEGLRYEAAHVASDHQGLIANAPLYYLGELRHELGWGLMALALFELVATAALPRQRRRAELWIAPLAMLVLFATICSTKIVFLRYLLPVTVLMHYFAALGALTLGEIVIIGISRLRRVATQLPAHRTVSSIDSIPSMTGGASLASGAVALLVLAPLLVPHVMRQRAALAHFAHDRREDLQVWANDPTRPPAEARALEAIPPDARVLQEHLVAMERWAVPFELRSVRSIAFRMIEEQAVGGQAGPGVRTPEDLAAEGYTHVAIVEDRYRRFFDDRLRPTPEFEPDYEKIRAMYRRLLAEDGVTLIYEYVSPPGRPEWINPTIRIYRLPSGQ